MSSHDEMGKQALWCLFYKGTNPFYGGSVLTTYHHPQTPSPDTITSIYEFGEGHMHLENRNGDSLYLHWDVSSDFKYHKMGIW